MGEGNCNKTGWFVWNLNRTVKAERDRVLWGSKLKQRLSKLLSTTSEPHLNIEGSKPQTTSFWRGHSAVTVISPPSNKIRD